MARKIGRRKLREIVDGHADWLRDGTGGCRADLRNADLRGADLEGECLRGADLGGADLEGAYLRDADLRGANLRGACLKGADLSGARLRGTGLSGADLRDACLKGADLRGVCLRGVCLRGATLLYASLAGADFRGADLRECMLSDSIRGIGRVIVDSLTAGWHPVPPETGPYEGWKAAGGCLVHLRIPEDARRSSGTTRKCRADRAEVLGIHSAKTGEKLRRRSVASDYDPDFVYRVGETVRVEDFCDDRWQACAAGIHHFLTKSEAIAWAGL